MISKPESSLDTRLEELLAGHRAGLSEHALLRRLADEGREPFAALRFSDEFQLFRAHFVLFNALYRLRDRLREEKRAELRISPLEIVLAPYDPGRTALSGQDALRAWYLDETNLDMGRGEVRRLLEDFHAGAVAARERRKALEQLELSEPVDYPTIKRRYRELAMRHHPDRGGDTASLQRLNRAMQVLEHCFGRARPKQ